MAIKIKGGTAAPSQTTPSQTAGPQNSTPAQTPAPGATGGSKGSWMMRGARAQAARAQEEAKAEARQSAGMYFLMKPGEDRVITFLDGDLDENGVLNIPMYYDHMVQVNGKWMHFPCLEQFDLGEPCPICQSDKDPSFVGLLTVINHTPYTGRDEKVYVDETRLFMAKRETFRKLSKVAAKRGGLAGCRFEVSRTSDRSASVGDMFEFEEKVPVADVMAKYNAKPLDYESLIKVTPRDELIKLGFGTTSIGAADSPSTVTDQSIASSM